MNDKGEGIKFIMHDKAKILPQKIPELLEKYQGKLQFKPETVPFFIYKESGNRLKSQTPVLENVKIVLNDLKLLLE